MKYKINEVSLIYKQKYDTSLYPIVKNSKDSFDIFYESWDKDLIGLEEHVKVLFLNRRNQVLGIYCLSIGGIAGSIVCTHKLFACALKIVASGIILAHNHPSGNLNISESDKKITDNIKTAGEIIGIKLLDHIIITPNGLYYSFADEGKI